MTPLRTTLTDIARGMGLAALAWAVLLALLWLADVISQGYHFGSLG